MFLCFFMHAVFAFVKYYTPKEPDVQVLFFTKKMLKHFYNRFQHFS